MQTRGPGGGKISLSSPVTFYPIALKYSIHTCGSAPTTRKGMGIRKGRGQK